jgi:hypothetical protein
MVPVPEINLGADHSFCEGTSVTLDAGSGYVSYLWNTGETTSSISISTPGDYWTVVSDNNECSASDTISLTMNLLPTAPEMVSGPVNVDNFLNPTSEFTVTESLYASSYEWKIEPVAAGTLSGTGLTAQVSWSAGYTGTVTVTAAGKNECGTGPFSQALAVSVYSSQSIDEKQAVSAIKLYPNPNNGAFTLEFVSGKNQDLRFRFTNAGGLQVFESGESVMKGKYQRNFNLGTLPADTYYLVILDPSGKMLNRVPLLIQ